MNVEVRLFATLRQYLPPGSSRTSARLEVPPGASIDDVLEKLTIKPASAALVLVNGHYERNRQRSLSDGCILSVWPHVAGG